MSPGQLGIIAAMHKVANTGEPDHDTPPTSETGTVADLAMMARMTRG